MSNKTITLPLDEYEELVRLSKIKKPVKVTFFHDKWGCERQIICDKKNLEKEIDDMKKYYVREMEFNIKELTTKKEKENGSWWGLWP